jgi:hypothetical protein
MLAILVFAATAVLVVIGTIWPVPAAKAFAGGGFSAAGISEHITTIETPSTPENAVNNVATYVRLGDWTEAYNSLANKAEFTQGAFERDLMGSSLSLRTYATLDDFDMVPLHESDNSAEVTLQMHWSTVVGIFDDTRDLQVVKNGDRWAVDWPLVKQPTVPPQVIPVNYLRWDVIYPGAGDEWGAQQPAPPHVRIVDMHPLNRAEGTVVMGELLNDDVVPAFVSVRATLIGKDGSTLASEGCFDMISHTLLPKQVTPFLIQFHGIDLSQVSKIEMDPTAILVPASADPVVEVQNQKLTPIPNPALTGQLSDQSGETVNVAHVLSTFYDKNGQVVWVGGEYMDRALLPQTPVNFNMPVPEDLAKNISSEHTIVASYVAGDQQ